MSRTAVVGFLCVLLLFSSQSLLVTSNDANLALQEQQAVHTSSNTAMDLGIYLARSPVAQVEAPLDGEHTCFVDAAGAAFCFGDNGNGQLGDNSYSDRRTPVPVVGLSSNVSKITTGRLHTCALLDNGSVNCWGLQNDGRLGTGSSDTGEILTPTPTSSFGSGRYAVDIAAGDSHTCVILDDGTVRCWGEGGSGRLGGGSTIGRTTPTATSSLGSGKTAVAISSGERHTCVVLNDGTVKCWGTNVYGQIGNGQNVVSYPNPTSTSSFSGGRSAVQVAAGNQHTCAILDDGNASCWGWNQYGQLGIGSSSNAIRTPSDVSMGDINGTFRSLSLGYYHTCGVLNTSQALCWGGDTGGVLGDGGFTANQNTPVYVTNLSNGDQILNITASHEHTCATFTDGSLRCWGDNGEEKLGLAFVDYSSLDEPSGRPIGALSVPVETEVVEGINTTLLVRLHHVSSNHTLAVDAPPGMSFDNVTLTLSGIPSFTLSNTWNYSVNVSGTVSTGSYTLEVLRDTDGDGIGNKYDLDDDGDQFADDADSCPIEWGNSSWDREGCPDDDGDGVSNLGDEFPRDATQQFDADQDGYGDNALGTRGDDCPTTYGESRRNNVWGCVDTDYDGWDDGSDAFPYQSSQWNDSDGDGFGDEFSGFQGDACPSTFGNSTVDAFGCVDGDGDGHSNAGEDFPLNPTQHRDRDGDGYGDNQSAAATQVDAFPLDGTQWNDTDGDGHGDNPYGTLGDWFPNDPSRWEDTDRDGHANEDDAFVNDPTQWNDTDGDGYGDNANGSRADQFPNDANEWGDADGDGVGDNSDAFPFDGSQSSDRDGDGYGDNPNGFNADAFPDDATRHRDSDGDGVADEDDLFPNDGSQTQDADNDGFGDAANGTRPDAFPDDPTEWSDLDGDGVGDNSDAFIQDGTQWNDTDGDGYGDNLNGNGGDAFPNDPSRWSDLDGDGVADEDDAFPSEPTQQTDRDGDGYGDASNGAEADLFPDDSTEWSDSDNDGVGDNSDRFRFDPTQTTDRDGDGYGDNATGTNGDAFPDEATQWSDIDGDGLGDNLLGLNPDAFPNDATQWNDTDGDGYGDNLNGRNADLFPDNPTQHADADGDGLGDNQSGTEADPSLNDLDNDGYTDDEDTLPKLASPGDKDNDGVSDEEDAFPDDFRESKDSDGDGEGDNADPDDDNDGWTDVNEIREGRDPYNSASQPVEGFEVVLPGTQVSLGAWDLIGVFTGVPLGLWISVGLLTRSGRARRFEVELDQAEDRQALYTIAVRYENALMWRMIGPHQGMRLERLRTEIEKDRFADDEGPVIVPSVQGVPGAETLSKKIMPAIEPTEDANSEASSVERHATEDQDTAHAPTEGGAPPRDARATEHAEGYEWIEHDGKKWYRAEGNEGDWSLWSD